MIHWLGTDLGKMRGAEITFDPLLCAREEIERQTRFGGEAQKARSSQNITETNARYVLVVHLAIAVSKSYAIREIYPRRFCYITSEFDERSERHLAPGGHFAIDWPRTL